MNPDEIQAILKRVEARARGEMPSSPTPTLPTKTPIETGDKDFDTNAVLQRLFDSSASEEQRRANLQVVADQVEQQRDQMDGFLKRTAKSILKPFAKVGVTAYNLAASTGKAIQGDTDGAMESLYKSRKVPFLGETEQVFSEGESTGEGIKKIVGTGLDIGSTIAGGAGVSQVAKAGVKGAIMQGAKAGLKSGALTGALSGTGTSLEEGESVGQSLLSGAVGGVVGGATGAAIGGASGALGAGIKKGINTLKTPKTERIAKKETEQILELIRPELNKTEKAAAIAQGRGAEKGLLKQTVLKPTKREDEIVGVIRNVVDPTDGYISNIQKVKNEIGKEADVVVENLKKNNVIFNNNQLKTRLGKVEKSLSLSADDKLNKMYDLAQGKFMEFVDKNPKNLSGLLKSRKEFDNWIEGEIPRIWDDPTSKPLHDALRKMRTAANDFISEKLPSGSSFKDSLRKQSLMYEAIDNMSQKAAKEVDTTALQRLAKKNPLKTKALKYGAVLGGGSIIGGVAGNLLD